VDRSRSRGRKARHHLGHHLGMVVLGVPKYLVKAAVFGALAGAGLCCWRELPLPWNWVLGVPLLLVGVAGGLQAVYEVVMRLFSWEYNKQRCLFCEEKRGIREILGLDRRRRG